MSNVTVELIWCALVRAHPVIHTTEQNISISLHAKIYMYHKWSYFASEYMYIINNDILKSKITACSFEIKSNGKEKLYFCIIKLNPTQFTVQN